MALPRYSSSGSESPKEERMGARGPSPSFTDVACPNSRCRHGDDGLGQVKKRENEPTAAHTLYDLIDRRHTNVSTALTSNIHLSSWGKYLGDAHLAVAVLDRLAMRGVRIDIDGPSYRQHVAQERAKKQRRPLPGDSSGPLRT
jgi:hypothetical protein